MHELQTSGVSKVDVLINNAGILMNRGSPMSALSNLDFANILDTNVVGPHNVISAFIPMLKVEGSKKIVVNISSGLGSVEMNSGNMTGGKLSHSTAVLFFSHLSDNQSRIQRKQSSVEYAYKAVFSRARFYWSDIRRRRPRLGSNW